MRWIGHIARMGRSGMHTGFCWGSQKKGDLWEALDVGGIIILKWILEKYDGILWIGFILLRIGASGVS
jgi:hypothetical protein